MDLTILETVLRVLAALSIGLIIGFDRERQNKAAGLVTHALLALSTAAIAILQVDLYNDSINFAIANPELGQSIVFERQRIVAQVLTGVGFLGGGAILKTKNHIHGLTTAATLWASAIMGIIFGMGYFVLGAITSVFIVLLLYVLKSYMRKKNANGYDD